jgi:hypothetical protein
MRSGITRFFLKLFIVLALAGILIFYCELRLRAIPNTFTLKKNYFEQKLDSIQILILGSSETVNGINPSGLSKYGFNLASESQSLYYDTELTLNYIDKMPKLEYVLISIAYFSLWYEVHSGIENWRDYYYYHFWRVSLNTPKIFDLRYYSYIALYGTDFSQVAFRNNFKIFVDEETITKTGWSRRTDSMVTENIDSFGERLTQTHTRNMSESVFENNVVYLDKLLRELTKRKLTPVFVSTPVFYSYSNRMDPQKIKTTEGVITGFCSKYHCRYINFLSNSDFKLSDFADPAHLNFRGAEKLTRLINDKLLSQTLSN